MTFDGLTVYVIYLNSVNCTKLGQSIVRKIIEIVATRCHILRLKCTKFDFCWGSASDPAGERSPGPYLDTRGPGMLTMPGKSETEAERKL